MTGKATAQQRPNLHFTITDPDSGVKYPPDPAKGWITDKNGLAELLADKRLTWPPDAKTGKPRKKRFLSETKERMPASSFWSDVKGESGSDEVDRILGRHLFDFPKSVEFLRRIVDLAVGPEDTVLDCTAGSGTTAHAILEANHADSGRRRFILVQQPYETQEQQAEKFNITAKVTAERVRRVMRGYSFDDPKQGVTKVNGLGGEFTYLRVGRRLFDEYRDLGDNPPAYEQMARYIWFTETSQNFDASALSAKSWRIGAWQDTSYYLLYRRGSQDAPALDADFLRGLKDKSARKVIYCEKLWIHREELRAFGDVRPMLIPFQLK